jgi:catechol 2,3-dioxygenase-like lactoylglutathione lyase family enzyme
MAACGLGGGIAMDHETVAAPAFGRSLGGLGLNLLVRDAAVTARFLTGVLGMTAHRVSADFAIMRYGLHLFQLHGDATFAGHPLHALLPEAGPRGAGVEIRLFDTDPDAAWERARACNDAVALREPQDWPHGLREAVILCPDGYAWVPSRPLAES